LIALASSSTALTDAETARVRDTVFAIVNADRVLYGRPALERDALTDSVAQAHADEMLALGYIGHRDASGLTPYLRFGLRGIAYGEENITAAVGEVGYGIAVAIEEAASSHARMMAERAPHDGHKLNILGPLHTHMGVGVAHDSTGFRLVTLFINRHVEFDNLPRRLPVGASTTITGRALDGAEVRSVSVFHEPFPGTPDPDSLSSPETYALPSDRVDVYPRLPGNRLYHDGSKGSLVFADDGSFSFPLSARRRGYLTVVLWVIDSRTGEAGAGSGAVVVVM
jgi:uncharacterized protein YkwD